MKITCHHKPFAEAFSLVASCAGNDKIRPILGNVLIRADDNGVTLQCTDLEVSSTTRIPADVKSPGEALLPAGRFRQIAQSAKSELTVCASDRVIEVRDASGAFKLPAANPADYPSCAPADTKNSVAIPCRALREAIRRTAPFSVNEGSRYALMGVAFDCGKDGLFVASTDLHRLSSVRLGDGKNCPLFQQPSIVPIKGVRAIEKFLGDDGDAEVFATDSALSVKSGDSVVTSRLVEGRFPKWRTQLEQWTPKERIAIRAGELAEALSRAAITSTETSVGVVFQFADGKLSLSSRDAEAGESVVEMPVSFTGNAVVKLDPRFVLQFIKMLPSESTFEFGYLNKNAGVTFIVGDGTRHMIAPLNME